MGYDERSDGDIQSHRVYKWQTNMTTNYYDIDFNPELLAMKFITDIAANSIRMQFLNREVCQNFPGTVKTTSAES